MADQVIVPVRSAWASRVNQIAIGVFGLVIPIGTLAPILPDPYKGYALTAVSLLGALGVWYYRTFQTQTVTPSSVTPASSAVAAMKSAGVPDHQVVETLNALSLAQAQEKSA